MMSAVFSRPGAASCLLLAFLSCDPPALARPDAPSAGAKAGIAPARAATTAADPRFRSPRATVRTFLIAMNRAEDDPKRIEEAAACLDVSGMVADRRDGGRLAFELEFILRSTNIPTGVIPDVADGTECTIGESKDIRITLRRKPDGRWLVDGTTLADLPKMRLALWQRAVTAGQGKEAGDVPAEYRSPYASIHTFIDSFKRGDLDTAATCLDLTDIPDPARGILGRELALKLKEVLDRTMFVIFQDLPDTSVGIPLEALIHKEGRIAAERQVTGVRKGQWLFNRATVGSLDRLYDAFESQPILPDLAATGRTAAPPGFTLSPGLWLRHQMPGWLKHRIAMGQENTFRVYQLAGLFVLLLLVLPLYRSVVRLLALPVRALIRFRVGAAEDRDVLTWSRPLGWLLASWVFVRGVSMLDLPTDVAGAVLAVLVPAYWFVVAVAVCRLIDPVLKVAAGPAVSREGPTSLTAMGMPVVSLVLKIVVLLCGLAAILRLFEFDVGTVLAGLGIGGLAFALAAQDTLKNFFGSLMLIADRTFRVGDLVKIGENEGVVESVGLRSTRIRALDDALLTVPNSDLTTAHVTNFGARRFRRYRTRIAVAHSTPTDRLVEFRDGILGLLRGNPQVRQQESEVALNDLGGSGIEILIQVFFMVSDDHAELLARDALILDTLRLSDRLGITFESVPNALEREPGTEPGMLADNSAPADSP